MIDVYFWSPKDDCPHKGYWATTMIEDLFNGEVWLPNERYEFNVHEGKPGPDIRGCVLVVPGRFETPELFNDVQTVLDGLDWVVFFYVADEDQSSKWWELKHPNIEFYVQAAKKDQIDTQCASGVFPTIIPFGYTPHTRQVVRDYGPGIDRDWFISFMGQDTHQRRHELVESLSNVQQLSYVKTSKQFAGGIDPVDYIRVLCNTKIAPAPGGPVAVDSFRLYEALEAGCLVVADCKAGNGSGHNYWYDIFINELPVIPIKAHWSELNNVAYSDEKMLEGQETWREYKRNLARGLHRKIHYVSQEDYDFVDTTTFIITTSPIESHPSTEIISQTVESIRYWHPTSEIVIVADGIRPEQEHLRDSYIEYLKNLNWTVNHIWKNVHVLHMGEFSHQVKMTRYVLDYFVETPLICFLEHDTPLVTDEPIQWAALKILILEDELDVVRLYHEGQIPKEHVYLYDDRSQNFNGALVRRTRQWSQRPHIAKASYYRKILKEHFTEGAITFIEDKMHSVAQVTPDEHRIAIYTPAPGPGNPTNWKRSLHSDGRNGGPKFDDELIF